MTDREVATVVAALIFWRHHRMPAMDVQVPDPLGREVPLDDADIAQLIWRLVNGEEG